MGWMYRHYIQLYHIIIIHNVLYTLIFQFLIDFGTNLSVANISGNWTLGSKYVGHVYTPYPKYPDPSKLALLKTLPLLYRFKHFHWSVQWPLGSIHSLTLSSIQEISNRTHWTRTNNLLVDINNLEKYHSPRKGISSEPNRTIHLFDSNIQMDSSHKISRFPHREIVSRATRRLGRACHESMGLTHHREHSTLFIAYRIHGWYIYLHLVDFYGKCR